LLNLGLETLPLRMERHCENALRTARFLESSDKAEAVIYPGLPGHPHHERAKKYLKGASGVVSLILKDGRDAAVRFMDSLRLAVNQVHVADIRTCVLHPASTTHRQLAEEDLAAAGVHPGMVRISVGLEHIDDILEDLEQALRKC
jgi:O-acetylhomoserine (thiol)-lyase